MKLFKLTFIFALISFSAFGKDSTTVEFKRFAFGVHASPDYCFRTLKILNQNSTTEYIVKYREGSEVPSYGYTAGADLSFFIKKQFAVSLGGNFSQKTYQSIMYTLVDVNGITMGDVKFLYTYKYIEIPVKANLFLGKKKVRFLASAGVSPAFMLYQQTISKTTHSDGSKETKKGQPNYIYNPFNLFFTGSIGMDIKLGKKMGVKIEPTYTYGLLQTIDAPITEHLWNYGFNVGWHIDL